MNVGKQIKEGLWSPNPVLVQLLGMCSTLAITTSFSNGLGMGVSVTIILTLSNVIISLLRKIIPDKIRIAAYIVVIATFVTMVDLLLQAYLPDIAESLGVFIPLIVVNCIILARAEAFASKNRVYAGAAGDERDPGVPGQRNLRRGPPQRRRGLQGFQQRLQRADDGDARGRLSYLGCADRADAVGAGPLGGEGR